MRSLRALLVLLSLAAGGAASAQTASSEAAARRRDGDRAFLVGRYLEAAHAYEQSYVAQDQPDLLPRIGEAYDNGGDVVRALRYYRLFLEGRPGGAQRARVAARLAELDPPAPSPSLSPPRPPPTPAPPARRVAPVVAPDDDDDTSPPLRAAEPQAAEADEDAPPPRRSSSPRAPRRGWALGAGIYGLIASTWFFSLVATSEATRSQPVPSAPVGALATTLHVISVPIVAAGGASARRGTGARGLPAARVVGWISYALTLIDSMALFAYTFSSGKLRSPPPGLILSAGFIGLISGLCMSADAIASYAQAAHSTVDRSSPTPRRRQVLLAPTLAVSPGSGAVIGLVGTF